MTLSDGRIGENYRVKSLNMEERIMRRLESMGINEKTPVKVLNKKSSGVIIIMVRGTRLAIGKEIAGGIEVNE